MSGGYWDYIQYQITNPVDSLRTMSENPDYPEDVRQNMRECARQLTEGAIRLQRLDWLLSGDDGVESYRLRLRQDLSKVRDGHSDIQFHATCPECPSFVNRLGETRRPTLTTVESNWHGTGADIAECDKCGEVFQINYKIDNVVRFQ